MHTKPLWTTWKDNFTTTQAQWRMQTPIGVLSYHRKGDAIEARNLYIHQTELRLLEERRAELRQLLAETHPDHYTVGG